MLPKNEKLTIVPYTIYHKINDFMNNIKDDILCDQDETRKKYYFTIYNKIKIDLLGLINSDIFWNESINFNVCDHRYKSGMMAGYLCNKFIEIKPQSKETKCAKHISKLKYDSQRKKNVNKELCISLNNKGQPCRNYKKFGDFCTCHYTRVRQYLYCIEIDVYYLLLYDINIEIYLLSNIDISDNIKPNTEKVINKGLNIKSYVYGMINEHLHENIIYNIIDNNRNIINSDVHDLSLETQFDAEFVENMPIMDNVTNADYDKKLEYLSHCYGNDIVSEYKYTHIDDINKNNYINYSLINFKNRLKQLNDKIIKNNIVFDELKSNIIGKNNKYKIQLEKIYKYIKCNNNYYYLLKNNNNKSFYIKEKEIIKIFEIFNARYNVLISDLYGHSKNDWIDLIEDYKYDIDEIVFNLDSIDNKYKIYI